MIAQMGLVHERNGCCCGLPRNSLYLPLCSVELALVVVGEQVVV